MTNRWHNPRSSADQTILQEDPENLDPMTRNSVEAKLICLDNLFLPEDQKGLVIQLGDADVFVGRSDENTVFLDYEKISRKHARIHRKSDLWAIEDLNSANGVYVNNEKITNSILQPGDIVGIGPIRFRYERIPGNAAAFGRTATTFTNHAESDAEKTMQFNDTRASEALLAARSGEDTDGRPPPLQAHLKAGKNRSSTEPHFESKTKQKKGKLRNLVRLFAVFTVLIGLCGGGFHYQQYIYKVRNARNNAIEKYSKSLDKFTSEYEIYSPIFNKASYERETLELKALLNQIETVLKKHPDTIELKAIQSTLSFMLLVRKVRYLLEKRMPGAMSISLEREKTRLDEFDEVGTQNELFDTIEEMKDLLTLLHIVSRYKIFQLKYPLPQTIDKEKIPKHMVNKIVQARDLRHDFADLRKKHHVILRIQFPYFYGMVKEVDDYCIPLVNKWYNTAFTNS